MISNTTTLAAAVAAADGIINVTSATGITGPGINRTTVTNVWIDRECMAVTGVNGTAISVTRGVDGSLREAHVNGSFVWVGAEIDFRSFSQGFGPEGLGVYSFMGPALFVTNETTGIGSATLTTAQIMGGLIVGTPVGAANYTLPTATLIIAALQNISQPFINQSFEFVITNTSAGANTITVVAGTGITLVGGTVTVAQNAARRFRVVVTNVLVPAVAVYQVS